MLIPMPQIKVEWYAGGWRGIVRDAGVTVAITLAVPDRNAAAVVGRSIAREYVYGWASSITDEPIHEPYRRSAYFG